MLFKRLGALSDYVVAVNYLIHYADKIAEKGIKITRQFHY